MLTETNTGRVSVFKIPAEIELKNTPVYEVMKLIAKQLHIPLSEIHVNTTKYTKEDLTKEKKYNEFMNKHLKDVGNNTTNVCYEVITEGSAASDAPPAADLNDAEKKLKESNTRRQNAMIKEFPFSKG